MLDKQDMWSVAHNSHAELSKFRCVCFTWHTNMPQPDFHQTGSGTVIKCSASTWLHGVDVMVHPPVLHVPPKLCLCLQRLDPFPMLSDQPLIQLGHWSTSHSLSQTLICFYYPSLLDTLNSPCLHFDPRPSSPTSVSHTQLSDSVSDSCIVADTVGTPQLDL